jgi:hypothetical protein
MSWYDRVLQLLNRYRMEWRLFYDGAAMECRIVNGPAGAEIQYFYRGELYHSFLHPTRAEAEDEARQKRSDLIQVGWTERVERSTLAHSS